MKVNNHTLFVTVGVALCLLIVVQGAVICKDQENDPAQETKPNNSMRYNELGKTGLKVSVIGFGAGGVTDPALVQYGLDNGINYFDTAEDYARNKSEETIGKVAAKHRDKMIICTKIGLDEKSTKESITTQFEACLKRLQTSYVDILMIHGGNKSAVENPAVFETFNELKKSGKTHFIGISHHGPNITKELRPLIAEKKVDVILCGYDPIGYSDFPEMVKEARANGIGLIAMKVLQGAKKANLDGIKTGKVPFNLAAMRWAIDSGHMDSYLLGVSSMDQIDEHIADLTKKE